MYTLLGAGGSIANEFASRLLEERLEVRLVSRHPKPMNGATVMQADLTNSEQTAAAIAGSSVVLLAPGLKYDIHIWEKQWPLIMQNTIDGCKRHGAKLIFFDNIYCLGKVVGPMTETSPINPNSRKGEVRAVIAQNLLNEIAAGNITAMIARSADFYGPNCKTSAFNSLVMEKFVKGKKAQCLLSDSLPHSYTYTPDCGRALRLLASSETAWDQVWHLPTAHPALNNREMIGLAAEYFGTRSSYQVLGKWMLRMAGIFSKLIRELNEMNYQNDSPYIFDSSKFERAFQFDPTSYREGIRQTVESYQEKKTV